MESRNIGRRVSVKAGTMLLAAAVVGTGTPVMSVLASDVSDAGHERAAIDKDTQIGLRLEGDTSVLPVNKTDTVRDLLSTFVEKSGIGDDDVAAFVENCGIYLRCDSKSGTSVNGQEFGGPGIYERRVMEVDGQEAYSFLENIKMHQDNTSDGWVQVGFTSNADGTGRVMNDAVYKMRVVEQSGIEILEFNAAVLSSTQVKVTYHYNGGKNTARPGTTFSGYRYTDELFSYPDLQAAMEKDGLHFAGWYRTQGAADTLDDTQKVQYWDTFAAAGDLYAGWKSEAPSQYFDIAYYTPDGDEVTIHGNKVGKVLTFDNDGSVLSEGDLDLSAYVSSDDFFLGYFDSPLDSAREYQKGDTLTEGDAVYIKSVPKVQLDFLDASGRSLGTLDFAFGYPIGKFNAALPSFVTSGEFRLENYKKIELGTVITEEDLGAYDTATKVNAYDASAPAAACTVTFDANGGTVQDGNTLRETYTVEKNEGMTVGTLPTAIRSGKGFLGWFTSPMGGSEVSSSTVVMGDVTYYAHWSDSQVTITVHANGGTVTGDTMYHGTSGERIGTLPVAVRNEYRFLGWYADEGFRTEVTEDTVLTQDLDLWAKWEPISEIRHVTFDANGGSVSETGRDVQKGDPLGALPSADYAGYDFLGWFTAASGGTKVTASTIVDEDATYYAHWAMHSVTNPVTSLALNKGDFEVDFGEELGLAYSFAPADADNAVFYWTSSDENVIKVVNGDEFQYIGSGTVTLTVHTLDDRSEASVTVTVNNMKRQVTSLGFDYPVQSVKRGGENNVNLGYHYGPIGADNANFKFTTSDPEIIRVSEDGTTWSYGGKDGTVTITVMTLDETIFATCEITVEEKEHTDPTPDKEIYHNVSFNTGSSAEMEPVRVKDGGLYHLPTISRGGYEFLGWYTMDGEHVTELTVTADITVYARWRSTDVPPTMHTVHYDMQNGTPAISIQVEEGQPLGVLPSVTRDGYGLVGWFDSSAGGNPVGPDTVVTGSMTVYAQWESNAVTHYTLRLEPNHGFVNGQSTVIDLGSALTENRPDASDLSQYVPARPGYTFTGWYDNPVGGHLVYDVQGHAVDGRYWLNGSYTGGTDINLYAQWARNTESYKLRLDVRGGNVLQDLTYDIGTTVTAFPTPTKAGYEFLGWYADATGGEPVTEVLMNHDVRLYAQWKALFDETAGSIPIEETVTVTYVTQMDGVSVGTQTVNAGTKLNLPIISAADETYTFNGWYTEAEGGDRVLGLVPEEDVTLYAHWTRTLEAGYTVYFDYCCGGTKTRVKLLEGEGISVFPDPVRAGYRFVGWFTEETGGQEVTSCQGGEDTTFYARWERDSGQAGDEMVTLTYDVQGGHSLDAVVVQAGTRMSGFPMAVREGYTFLGWFTEPEGGSHVSSLTMDQDTVLYAHWEAEQVHVPGDPDKQNYKVILDTNYGDGEIRVIEIEAGNTFPGSEFFAREGYTFLGWFTSRTGGTQVTVYEGPDDITLYAHWEKAKPSQDVETVFWTLGSDADRKPITEFTVSLQDTDGLKDLLYSWSPKDAAAAGDFEIRSSNPEVIRMSSETWVEVLSRGQSDLTVVYKKDEAKSAVLHVTVTDDGASVTDADREAADAVVRKIDLIGTVEATELSKARIEDARKAYDMLTDAQKALVTNLSVLEHAESAYAALTGAEDPHPDRLESVYWTNSKDPDRKPVTDVTISMQDIQGLSDIIFTWVPGDAATIDDFVITSSDPTVLEMRTERLMGILKAGKADLTVTYVKDETKSAVLHVTVTDGNGGTPSNPVIGTPPTGTGSDTDPGSNPSGDGSGNGNAGNNGGGTTDNSGTGSTANLKQGPYKFKIMFSNGDTRNITVQDPQSSTIADILKTVSQLDSRLTNVVKVTVKTATMAERDLDMNTSMVYLAELATQGDVLLIGYDKDGKAIGSAKVTEVAEKEYTVSLSRDTNVALRSKSDAAGANAGGKDASSVSNAGKSDAKAATVQTSDAAALPVYGGFAAMLGSVLSGLAFWKRKRD